MNFRERALTTIQVPVEGMGTTLATSWMVYATLRQAAAGGSTAFVVPIHFWKSATNIFVQRDSGTGGEQLILITGQRYR